MLEINLNIMKMENGKMIERFIILCAAQYSVMQVKDSFIRAHLLMSNAIHFSITTKRGC